MKQSVLSKYNTSCCCTKGRSVCDAPWGENEEVAVITQLYYYWYIMQDYKVKYTDI